MDEYLRVKSFGDEPAILVPNADTITDFFKYVPSTLLIHPKFKGWGSNEISFSKNIPNHSLMFVIKYDIISALKSANPPDSFDIKNTLFRFKTTSLSVNFEIKINVRIFFLKTSPTLYQGPLWIALVVNGSIVEQLTLNVELPTNSNFEANTIYNKINSSTKFMTDRFTSFGFIQVLSTQTYILRVMIFFEFVLISR
jgi:hypothetical protein